MRKQPDFQKLFFSHFGDKPRKVTYTIREDSNRYHDLIFLSSLIHDARFRREAVKLRGKRLTIPINRDCWELGIVDHADSHELHCADARLDISLVVNIEWRFDHGSEFSPSAELWIEEFWLVRETDETMKVTMGGFDWGSVITVRDEDLVIKLRDLEIPYLYSEKGNARADVTAKAKAAATKK